MAINTTTFESRLQSKFDSTTDPKEMLLLGKALESTVGSIAVSNVQTEGTTQVARVVAAMTGALPAQTGQAGKVLTSDGTDSSWQEGLPSQSGQGAKFLTTDGTSANWEALSSSALSAAFEVEAGKTVSAGDVVNYAAGKIGDNPVVNTQTALNTTAAGITQYNAVNDSGTIVLKASTTGSSKYITTGVVQSDGSINWNSAFTIWSGQSTSDTSVKCLGGDNFAAFGGWCSGGTGGTAYGWLCFFTINPVTGGLTGTSNTITRSYSGNHTNGNCCSIYPYRMSGNKVGIHYYLYNNWYGENNHHYGTATFTTGSISENSGSANTSSIMQIEVIASNSKAMLVKGNSTWRMADWNGTSLNNSSDFVFDTSYSSDLRVYRPSDNSDIFLCTFIDTSNRFVCNTYSYSGGSFNITNQYTIIASGAGVTNGSITGSGDNVIIGYEDDSKGYIASFTLNANTKFIEASGIAVVHNTANKAVHLFGPNNTNKYLAAFVTSSSASATSIVTVNAYATTTLNWLGVAQSSGTAGDSVNVIIDGAAGGLTGLTAGTTYYYDTTNYNGSVTTSQTDYKVGRASSPTEILLNA